MWHKKWTKKTPQYVAFPKWLSSPTFCSPKAVTTNWTRVPSYAESPTATAPGKNMAYARYVNGLSLKTHTHTAVNVKTKTANRRHIVLCSNLKVKLMYISIFFFTKNYNFRDFMFASLADVIAPKRYLVLKERICYKRANSGLYELTTLYEKKVKNEIAELLPLKEYRFASNILRIQR